MKLNIVYQEKYSRGELLLRTLLGPIYIGIPHCFLLFFLYIWGGILNFLAFWAVLFTGVYPKGFFNYQVNLMRWQTRVVARIYNMAEGYPAFGLNGVDDKTTLEVEYPERLSRGHMLLRVIFGFFYILIPHGVALGFRMIWTSILMFLAFWAVLFTGKYPKSWFDFNVGSLRWSMRLNLYWGFMTDDYPPFSGKE